MAKDQLPPPDAAETFFASTGLQRCTLADLEPFDLTTLQPIVLDDLVLTAADMTRLVKRANARPRRRRKRKAGPTASRDKLRRYRDRQRRGVCVLRIEIEEHAVAGYLLDTGRLSPPEALIRARVESATADVLRDLIARWTAG